MSSNSNKIDALNVDESKLDEYVIRVKDFCITNGLVLLSKPTNKENSNSSSSSIHDASFPLPVTLLPTLYPRSEFDFATALQPHFQQLVLSISNDYEFLKNSIKDVIKADDFTRRLWNICEIVKEEGISQPISLAILRNDYMLDLNKEGTNSPTILSQIELNTISCSFGAATTKISHLHKHSLRFTNNTNVLENHVKNENMSGLANGLVKAWRMYGNPKAKMVFLVSQNETNIGDQRLLEYKCIEVEPTLDVRRYTITDFANSGSLDEKKNLLIDGNEIGLVYFRSCYDPNDFIGDKEWDARLLIERSRAIKCPNIQVHLAGAKIVQQALTEPNALNTLVSNKDVIDRMKATFVDIYSIHVTVKCSVRFDENISQIIDLINAKADEFVLKPQREGGGNNIYKDDIRKFVKSCEKSELKGYILMRLVRPPFGRNYIVRAGRPVKREELISEIGIFGYYIANGRDLVENETTGYLLRTKSSGVNEGGVAAGFSALDSIVLV